MANARTTTISWLWGTPASRSTTSTTTTTTTTTTSTPATSRSHFHPVPTWRRPLAPRPSEDRFPVQGSGSTFSPSPPQVSPPLRHGQGLNPIGFWPNTPNVESHPFPPEAGVVDVLSPVVEPPPLPESQPFPESQPEALGVPGRATWVPGAPPGFHSSSNGTENSSSQESAAGVAGSVVVSSLAPLPPGASQPSTGHRTLKQGTTTLDPLYYAWDIRHQLPRGYWLTSGPSHGHFLNRSLDIADPALGEGEMVQGNSSGNKHDVGGPGVSPLPPFPPRPGSGGSQHSSTSSSLFLGGPFDVTPTSSFEGWEASSGPPLSFFSPELSFGHESFGTDSQRGPSDQANEAVPRGPSDRRPGGRDSWPSGRRVAQNTSRGADRMHVDYHSGGTHGHGHGPARDSAHNGESGRAAKPAAGTGWFAGAEGRVPTAARGTATLPTGIG